MTTMSAADDTSTTSSRSGIAARQIANVVAVISVIAMNALAILLPLGGNTTGELSDRYPSLVTPAGYVFSIWSVIYTLLIVFAVYQVRPSQRDNPRLQRLGWWFVANAALNIAWLFAWHYEQVYLALAIMIGLLASLIVIYERLQIRREPVPISESIAIRLPFSVYLGWITIATVANVTVALIEAGLDAGDLAAPIAVGVLAVAAGIVIRILWTLGDLAIGAVLVWAFIGVAVAQRGEEFLVVAGANLGAAAVVLVMAATAWQRFRSRAPVLATSDDG